LIGNILEAQQVGIKTNDHHNIWGCETWDDGQEQYALEIENFSGITPRVIAQDDHATILFANLSAVDQQEAEQQGDARRDPYQRKYERYRIHYRWLIATRKYRMIRWLWTKTPADFERQPQRFQSTIVRLMRDMVPVIPGCKAPRNKKRGRTNKFAHFEGWLRVVQTRRPMIHCLLFHHQILLSDCVIVTWRGLFRLLM